MLRVHVRGWCVGVGLWLVLAGSLSGQPFLQPAGNEEGLLVAEKMKPPESSVISDLRYGKSVDDPAKKRDAIAKAARWYTYRLTNPIYHREKDKNPENMTMNDLMQEAFRQMLLVPPEPRKKGLKPEQDQFVKELTKEMIPCLREVLSKNSNPLVRVNAGRMLAGIGETGQEEVTETLVDILKNPQELDAVKYFALHGLRELLAQGTPSKSVIREPKREAAAITELNKFVSRPSPLAGEVPTAEDQKKDYESQINGVRYVRREAVRALANTRYPIGPGEKGPNGESALWLGRIARKIGVTPEPSMSEQVEAAIGLCQMQSGLSKDYQVDYAALQVGEVIVEFVKLFGDQRNVAESTLLWRLSAGRLSEALDKLNAEAQQSTVKGAAQWVSTMVSKAKEAIKPIETGKEASATDLAKFLQDVPTPSKEMYRGVATSTLKTAG